MSSRRGVASQKAKASQPWITMASTPQRDAPVEQVGLDRLREQEVEHQDDNHSNPRITRWRRHRRDAKGAGERGVNNHGDVEPAVDEPEDGEDGGGLRLALRWRTSSEPCWRHGPLCRTGDESVAEAVAVPRRGRPEGVEQDEQRKRGDEEAEREQRRQALAVDLDGNGGRWRSARRPDASVRSTPFVARSWSALTLLIGRPDSGTVTDGPDKGRVGGGHELVAWPSPGSSPMAGEPTDSSTSAPLATPTAARPQPQ